MFSKDIKVLKRIERWSKSVATLEQEGPLGIPLAKETGGIYWALKQLLGHKRRREGRLVCGCKHFTQRVPPKMAAESCHCSEHVVPPLLAGSVPVRWLGANWTPVLGRPGFASWAC